MNKIAILLCLIISNLSYSQTARTIKTEGKGVLLVEPNEIGATFKINSESESTTGVKLSLEKIEAQLKQHVSKSGIPATKLEISNDPKICNVSEKYCIFKGLTFEEYNKLKPYLKKNIFISDFNSNYKISKKEDIDKYTEQLLKLAFDDSRSKADIIASNMGEKISGVQSIINPLFIKDYPLQLEKNLVSSMLNRTLQGLRDIGGKSDFEVEKLEINSIMIVEYNIESSKNTAPKSIRIDAMSEKKVPYQNANFSFTLSIEDYEEGDPAKLIEGFKTEVNGIITKSGVNYTDIDITDHQGEVGANYSFVVKGDQNIQSLYNTLSSNKNVTNLNCIEKPESHSKYENELIVNAMNDARDKIKVLEKATGLKSTKIVDVDLFGESTLTTNMILLTQSSIMKSMDNMNFDELVQDNMHGVKKLEKTVSKIALVKFEIQ